MTESDSQNALLEVVILVGLQGSGKSTFARARFAATHELVSKDLLRNHRSPPQRQRQLIAEALVAGRSVIVDNTNPSIDVRAELIALAQAHGARVTGYFFPPDMAACLERNSRRSGRARVPDVALYITARKIDVPSPAEGFDRLYRIRIALEGDFLVEEWTEAKP